MTNQTNRVSDALWLGRRLRHRIADNTKAAKSIGLRRFQFERR